MKTAIDEVVLKMQEAKDNFPSIGFDEEFIRGFNKAFQMAIFISDKIGKEKEKQQIIDAVKYGFNDATKPSSDQDITFQQYYNETFKQE